jgi:hypothetical protein
MSSSKAPLPLTAWRWSSGRGAGATASASTASPGAASGVAASFDGLGVNTGYPVGLPPDVLQHILPFLEGRGLAVCEQVCKGLRGTANDKTL